MGIQNLLATGYALGGERRPPHQGINAETPTGFEGNLTFAGFYFKSPTCVNRIGIVYSSEKEGLNPSFSGE
jgi:hypothetical protein